MKFVFITDIHLGLEKKYSSVPSNHEILSLLDHFVSDLTQHIQPDCVIVNGDLIEAINTKLDMHHMRVVTDILSNLPCPV